MDVRIQPLHFAIWVGLLALSLPARAAVAPPTICTQEMLDVQVLPPLEADTANELHLLVIEIQNRGQSSCQLRGPVVALVPESGADSFTNSFFGEPATSPSERQFEQTNSVIGPGDTVHVLIAWNSRDTLLYPGCLNRDGLTVSLDPAQPPLLTVEHLWVKVCDRAYVSHFRVGHYAGEPVPPEWLKRLDAQPGDFVPFPRPTPQQSQKSLVEVETALDREMLYDYFELFLELPRQDHDCPFVVARKREANGATKAYINHCKILIAEERARLHLPNQKWTARMNLPALGIQPQKPGTVEYDVFSSTLADGKPVYARARTSVIVRDSKFPGLPTIDSPLPDCQATQLRATKLPVLEGGEWHDAHVFEFTNISEQSCRVGGVPKLVFSHPEGQSYTGIPSPCPNCTDPLFQPRPSGWIDLRPHDSAHFLVGATRFNTESGPWRLKCTVVQNFTLELAGEKQSILLPFGVGACAQINISAWRAGRYDADPQNLVYAKSAAKHPLAELPKQCATQDFSQLGRPVIVEQNEGMAFGLSISPVSIRDGDPVPLHLWIDNQSNTESNVMTCSTLDSFWALAFDVYDANGHRLLKKNAQKRRQDLETLSHDQPDTECMGGWVCSRNFAIPIPPHTCANGSAYQLPYDFNRNLADSYDLPPGVYYIVPSAKFDARSCRATVPRLDRAALADKLRITIEPN
jgi:hypothetical protein